MTKFNIRGGFGDTTKPDVNTREQDNLYLAVNSKWLKDNPVPAGEPWISSFDIADKQTRKQLLKDFSAFVAGKKPVPQVKNFNKAVEFYRVAEDEEKRTADGAAPIKEDLTFLTSLNNLADVNKNLTNLLLADNLPFKFEVEPDFKDAQLNIVTFYRQNLILADTSYYGNEKTADLLDVWQKQTVNLLVMSGIKQDEAEQYATGTVKLDQRLAQVYQSAEYNSKIENIYHPMGMTEFENQSKNIHLADLMKENGLETAKKINVTEPGYLAKFDELFNEQHFSELKGWLIGYFINQAAGYLSRKFRKAILPLRKAMYGIDSLVTDERFAYDETVRLFGDVIGQYYGEKYLGAEAKADATKIVKNMIAVYQNHLKKNTWLSDTTKKKALKKLDTLVLKIGYPEHVQGFYDKFKVTPALEGGSLYSNVKINNKIKLKDNFADINRPVDRTLWIMSAVEPNACYNPPSNDITFPALLLQKPFYDIHQDRAANYGGFGAVVGHEISHAFDNNGAQFDELGNMKNWWTDEDYAEFNKRVEAEIKLFDGVEVGTSKINGKLTVSENIGDQGGLTVAVAANKQEGGDAKTLFENYARIWATNAKPEFWQLVAASDVHALSQARANVQVQCQEEFYQAFNVKEGDGMWLDPDKRVQVW